VTRGGSGNSLAVCWAIGKGLIDRGAIARFIEHSCKKPAGVSLKECTY